MYLQLFLIISILLQFSVQPPPGESEENEEDYDLNDFHPPGACGNSDQNLESDQPPNFGPPGPIPPDGDGKILNHYDKEEL
uniref:Secreted protein n=1 Tax=Acrobeloides nanus TaxID=290746 RepID=A0A914DCY4_9BILA